MPIFLNEHPDNALLSQDGQELYQNPLSVQQFSKVQSVCSDLNGHFPNIVITFRNIDIFAGKFSLLVQRRLLS